MDDYSGKRTANGLEVSRKGPSGLVLRETPNSRDTNTQFCNRLGCSGRPNSTKVTQTVKHKPLRPSLVRSSSSRKETTIASSSSSVTNPRNPRTAPRRKLSSHLESDSSETSSVLDEQQASELITPPVKIQRGLAAESNNNNNNNNAEPRFRKNLTQRSGLNNRTTSVGPASSVPTSTAVRASAGSTQYGLRSLKCSSVSDIVQSNCSSPSSSDSIVGRRSEIAKKRSSDGESSSSSSRGKKVNGSTSSGPNPPSSSNSSSNGVSISDSRRSRYIPPNRDNNNNNTNSVASVRPRRPVNTQTRARVSSQGSGNSSSGVITQRSYPEISIGSSSSGSSSHSRFSSADSSLGRSGSRALTSVTGEGFGRSLGGRDSLRRFNIDGIAEVLLALDRIEHDDGLSLEQLLTMETNLFLNGLNLYDQHRDMRLDIDNMSYEELLALEDRMGNVSTALTEEALSECLKRSIYKSIPSDEVTLGISSDNDDVKCSVCQEEYSDGDEVGRLNCEHRFHTECIEQWLRHKNWCPICKASAAQPSSTSA